MGKKIESGGMFDAIIPEGLNLTDKQKEKLIELLIKLNEIFTRKDNKDETKN